MRIFGGGGGVAGAFTTSVTTPLVIGGTAANSVLALRSTAGIGTTDAIVLQVGSNGAVEAMRILSGGVVNLPVLLTLAATNTAPGTTGAQTINKPTGTVNFAIGTSTLVVTNNLVTVNSLVFCVVRTNDATAVIKNVVSASGSFTITLNAAAGGETSVGFWVVNQ
jgi:hypothetical protein